MLRLSKKVLSAIEAVVDIAFHGGTEPVRSTEISRRQGVPRRYLEQVLQQLVHNGVLAGQRGPRGGYRLARERRRVTVGEIVRVVRTIEGSGDPDELGEPSEIGGKVVRPLCQEVVDQCMARLDEITIEDLCRQARQQGVSRASMPVPDYSI